MAPQPTTNRSRKTEELKRVEELGEELREAARRISGLRDLLRAIRDRIDQALTNEPGGGDT